MVTIMAPSDGNNTLDAGGGNCDGNGDGDGGDKGPAWVTGRCGDGGNGSNHLGDHVCAVGGSNSDNLYVNGHERANACKQIWPTAMTANWRAF